MGTVNLLGQQVVNPVNVAPSAAARRREQRGLMSTHPPISSQISKSSTNEGPLLPPTTDSPAQNDRFWGEYVSHAHCSRQNLINLAMCVVALLPSVLCSALLYSRCDKATDSRDNLSDSLCTMALRYPIVMANVLFFVNVSVGFWVVGMIQRSFWLIDP